MRPFIFLTVLAVAACFAFAMIAMPMAASAQVLMASGDAPLEVTAEGGLEWFAEQKAYVATGAAQLKRGDLTVNADKITAFAKANAAGEDEIWRLEAIGNVRIATKGQMASGGKALHDVALQVTVLSEGQLKFTSGADVVTAEERLEWWEKQGLAVARGNAHAVRALQSGRPERDVRADEMIAKLLPDEKGQLQIVRVDASGNVVITTASDVAMGSRASFDAVKNIAVLEGPVRIRREKGILEGARAEVNFANGQSRLLADGSGRVRALFEPQKHSPKSAAIAVPTESIGEASANAGAAAAAKDAALNGPVKLGVDKAP